MLIAPPPSQGYDCSNGKCSAFSALRLSLLYKSVSVMFLACSAVAVAATTGGEDGQLILSGVTDLTDDAYKGWPLGNAAADEIKLSQGLVEISADMNYGGIFGVEATFFGADVSYGGGSNNAIFLSENKVQLSGIKSSETRQVSGAFLLENSFGFMTGGRDSISLENNSASIDQFDDVIFNSFSGAEANGISGLSLKESKGKALLSGNGFKINNSKDLKISSFGIGHGIFGAYAHAVENSEDVWYSMDLELHSNYVTINNSAIEAVDSDSVEAWSWISGGSLNIFGNTTPKSASNKSSVTIQGNSVYVTKESQLTGKLSLYGANLRFDKGTDGRQYKINENKLCISDAFNGEATTVGPSIDVDGVIAGGMVDYFTGMNDIPDIDLIGNKVWIKGSRAKSEANGKGLLSGALAYAHGIYAENQIAVASPDLTLNSNEVTAESSTIVSSVYGGFALSQGGGQNKMNEWELQGFNNHEIRNSYYGMNAGNVVADGNILKVSGGSLITGDLYGAYAESNAMAGRFLIDFAGILGENSTPKAGEVSVSNNQVEIIDSTVNGNVYGGYAWSHGTEAEDKKYKDHAVNAGNVVASGNKLTITNSTIKGDVYGGYALSERLNEGAAGKMTADDNQIKLTGGNGLNLTEAHLYGSNLSTVVTKGNTLMVDGSAGAIGEVASLNNFNHLNFENLKWNTEQSTLVVNGGGLGGLTSITISEVIVNGELPVDQEQMTVLENNSADGLGLTDENVGDNRFVTLNNESTALEKEALISVNDEGDVILTVGGKLAPTDQTVLLAENRSVAVSFASLTNDLIPEVLGSIDNNEEGLKTFALMEGSAVKFDVNTDLKINGWYGLFGAGSSWRGNNGTLLGAAFIELGRGNYRTDNTFNKESFSGNGNIENYALGLATRYKWDSNLYVDAGMKVGWLSTDMDRALKNVRGEFFDIDSDSYYWSLHLGLGKVFALTDRSTLDLYGRYYYTYTGDESSRVGIDRYEADAISSHRGDSVHAMATWCPILAVRTLASDMTTSLTATWTCTLAEWICRRSLRKAVAVSVKSV